MKEISLKRIKEMAMETAAYGVHPSGEYIYSFYTEQLQAFARLVAEHERNECAKVCEELSKDMTPIAEQAAKSCATFIRGQE